MLGSTEIKTNAVRCFSYLTAYSVSLNGLFLTLLTTGQTQFAVL